MANMIDPDTLRQLVELGKPQGMLDIAALAAVGVTSAGLLLRGIAWDRPDPHHYIYFEKPQEMDGMSGQREQATRNIAEKMAESNKNMVIFWGSQSGTAESFANRLARECHLRFGLEVMAADLSDYEAETIAQIPNSKLALFIVSTYGEGDPSDNAFGLWDWITKNESLKVPDLRYAAFGLGNKNYKYYNRVVDVLVEGLERAGSQAFMPVGKADDSTGSTEEDFLSWKDSLFTEFRTQFGYEERDVPYTPSMKVQEDTSLDLVDLHNGTPVEISANNRKAAAKTSAVKPLTISSAHELYTNSPKRNCIHLELDLQEHTMIRYKTGDHLVVYPITPDDEVVMLLAALGLEGERATTPLLIQSLEEGVPCKLPNPTTVDALFRYYLEICAPVSRDAVRELAQFAPTPEAKNILTSLGKDREASARFVGETHVTMGRLLAHVAPGAVWSALPLSYLLETMTLLQPRYYSISSSSTVAPRKIAITVGVENMPLAGNPSTEVYGLTSNYLLSLANSLNKAASNNGAPTYALTGPAGSLEGHRLHAAVRRSKFKLPMLSSTPVIMVAAGTGMAPFRAFVDERARLKTVGKPVGRTILFFGCRRPEEDFMYQAELAEARKVLGEDTFEVVTAFSRAEGQPKKYVQDAVRERAGEVCDLLLEQSANLYVCGRAAMGREVGAVVQAALVELRGWDQEKVAGWSDSIKRGNKWAEDVWG